MASGSPYINIMFWLHPCKKVTSPRAFYKVQGLDAQRIIGRFLESASKRLPEEEQMLDPFLTLGDRDDKPESKNEIQKPFLNDNIKIEDLQLNEDLLRNTMTITGKLNPENETIFLKVQIADSDGSCFSPFDIVSDIPIGVANEMVKELEITDSLASRCLV